VLPLLKISKLYLLAILSLRANGGWIWTLKLGMMRQTFYHYATIAKHLIKLFYQQFSLRVLAAAGFKPLNLGWWGKHSTIMLQLLKISKLYLSTIFSPSASARWTRILKPVMMRQALYHYATIAKHLIKLFYPPFSLPVPVAAWPEPLNLGWWDKHSTTMLPLLKISKLYLLAIFSPSASGSWTRPLKLGIMKRVINPLATNTGNQMFFSYQQWLESDP
jgi:hypothetical protein